MPPQVVEVVATLGDDWDGESPVFFDVILRDDAIPRSELLAFTNRISSTLRQELRPLEEWGVLPYFRFLMQSEHVQIEETVQA